MSISKDPNDDKTTDDKSVNDKPAEDKSDDAETKPDDAEDKPAEMVSMSDDDMQVEDVQAPKDQAYAEEFSERGRGLYGDDDASPSWACYGVAMGIIILSWVLTFLGLRVPGGSLDNNIYGGILFWIATITIWSGCLCNCGNTVPHGCCCCEQLDPDYPNKACAKRSFVVTGWVLCACSVCWIILLALLTGIVAMAVPMAVTAGPGATLTKNTFNNDSVDLDLQPMGTPEDLTPSSRRMTIVEERLH